MKENTKMMLAPKIIKNPSGEVANTVRQIVDMPSEITGARPVAKMWLEMA
jgi:hypothetical protein